MTCYTDLELWGLATSLFGFGVELSNDFIYLLPGIHHFIQPWGWPRTRLTLSFHGTESSYTSNPTPLLFSHTTQHTNRLPINVLFRDTLLE